MNWSCLERIFAEATNTRPSTTAPPSQQIYQGLYGRQPEPKFREENSVLWSGPLPSSHSAGYRSILARMYLDDMGRYLSSPPEVSDVQAVVDVCWDHTDGPLEPLRRGEIQALEGRHRHAAEEVLEMAGPRIYVSIHSAMIDVFGKAHPGPKEA